MTNNIRLLFNIFGYTGGSFSGNVYDVNSIAPTLNTMSGGYRQPIILTDMEEIKIIQRPHGFNKGNTFDISPAITKSSFEQNNVVKLPPELQGRKFRIRKLTPRECFRLMGVDDADIDKIQESGISNTSQYKLAGNSIVVDVLFHLFRKMFIETGQDNGTKTLF